MVKFKNLKLQNFLSFGNIPAEIDLLRNQITLISGENGVGKSSILESISYVLFGKSYRPINKKQLINSINGRGLLVEVGFSVKGKEYLVRRGMKPDIFEIFENDVLINQEAASRDYQKHLEQNILGMNFKTFKQVVILSVSNYTPFMDLSSSDRRGIIEDLLDIQVFSVMNVVLSERKTELTEIKKKLAQKLKIIAVEIRSHNDKLESLKAKDRSLMESNQAKINEASDIIHQRMSKISELQAEVSSLNDSLQDITSLQSKHSKINVMHSRLADAQSKLEKEIEFFESNDSCPMCSQQIGEDLKSGMLEKKTSKISEIGVANDKVNSQLEEVKRIIRETQATSKRIQSLNSEIFQLNSSITSNQEYINTLEESINEIQSKGDSEEQDELLILKKMEDNRDKLEEKSSKIMIREDDYQVCQKLLKDGGIKSQIIDMYIPTINKILNHYLEFFGFPVSFNFDKNFNEVIRSRYRDEFSYASFSAGERGKIDICIVLTFREIAKLKNSVSTSLLFLDEIAENIDSAGVEKFIELINGLKDTNVMLITHKQDIIEKIHTQITLKKVDGFTVME